MNHLPSIIGLAPSELFFQDFLTKLSSERQRVRESLEEFRKRKHLKPSTPKASRSPTTLAGMQKTLGLTPAELLKGLELMKQMQKQ